MNGPQITCIGCHHFEIELDEKRRLLHGLGQSYDALEGKLREAYRLLGEARALLVCKGDADEDGEMITTIDKFLFRYHYPAPVDQSNFRDGRRRAGG